MGRALRRRERAPLFLLLLLFLGRPAGGVLLCAGIIFISSYERFEALFVKEFFYYKGIYAVPARPANDAIS